MKLPGPFAPIILAIAMTSLQPALAAGVTTADPGGETLVLWPDGAPGAARVTVRETFERAPQGPLQDRIVEHVTRPTVTLFHAQRKPNGVTLLIVPGGAYEREVIVKLHVFDRGGHGFGMRGVANMDVAAWPQLVENWALDGAQH